MNQRLVRISFFFLVSNPFLPQNSQNLVEAKQNVTNRLRTFNSCLWYVIFPTILVNDEGRTKRDEERGQFKTNNGRSEISRHVPFWKDKFTDPVLTQYLRLSSIFTDFPQVNLIIKISRIVIFISLINAGIPMRCYLCLNKIIIIWNILIKWNSDI